MIRKQWVIVLLIAALLVSGFAAPRAQAQGTSVLYVGYLGPADSPAANGAQLAIDQINNSGGFTGADGVTYRFELLMLTGTPTAGNLAATVSAFAAQDVVALLGPDNNALFTEENLAAMTSTGLPYLTPASFDTLTDGDADDVFLRIAAPNYVYSNALATYMIDDLGLSSFALVQTDVDSTEALIDFETVLQARGISVAEKIQLSSGDTLAAEANGLLSVNPEAVVMWGSHDDALTLLQLLRDNGWTGRFAYRHAEEAARAGVIPDALASSMLGVTNWSYAYTTRASRVFLQDYLTTFGEVPGPLAAATYDGMWSLRAAIISAGTDSAAVRSALSSASSLALVQGSLRPAEFGNGDIVRMAMVYELGSGGGPTVVAVFDNTSRTSLVDDGNL